MLKNNKYRENIYKKDQKKGQAPLKPDRKTPGKQQSTTK
jgi:hypothetical protein